MGSEELGSSTWPCSAHCGPLGHGEGVPGVLSHICSPDLYCTLEVDSFGYFVSKAKTRVFRDTTEPQWNEVREGGMQGGAVLPISPVLELLWGAGVEPPSLHTPGV